MMKLYRLLYVFYIFCFFFSYSQKKQTPLQKKIQENNQLLLQDPDKAFVEMNVLLKEAVKEKDSISELTILGNQCWYYDNKFAYGKSVEAAKNLESKAKQYKHPQMEAMAHLSLMSTYSQNSLYDLALKEFDEAMEVLSKTNPNDNRTLFSKVNLYISVNDVYLNLHRPYKALDNLWESEKLIHKINNVEVKKKMQILSFSNIGQVYTYIDSDSAIHYSKKSISLIPNNLEEGIYMFYNYLTLGKAFQNKKKYALAFENYKKAEKLKAKKTSLIYQESLYKGLFETSKILGNTNESEKYMLLLKNVQLDIEQNKNKSLYNIINKKLLDNDKENSNIIIFSGIIISMCVAIIFYLRRKNRILKRQEKASEKYLEDQKQILNDGNIIALSDMVKYDDPAFITAFNKIFPDFLIKLKSLNVGLAQTELEFCTLLKLNLSSKDIAKYKNIEPRSVQTKKHRIRKKLNIPKDEDIYHWFNNF